MTYQIYQSKEFDLLTRFKTLGLTALSNLELLQLFLGQHKQQEASFEQAQSILKQTDYLAQLEELSLKEWQRFDGIGEVKAIQLMASLELAKRIQQSKVIEREQIKNSIHFGKRLCLDYKGLKQEQVELICLNTQHRIISRKIIFKGSLQRCIAEPREILHQALREMAAAIILVHNHPSGHVKPSEDDFRFTLRLKKACDLINIKLLDHFIVSDTSYYSFNEHQQLLKD